MPDQLERLTSLIALLLETRVPLTLNDIHRRLEGHYADGEDARRASFERDKVVMRSTGIPISQKVLGGEAAGQTGYWIDRRDYELQDLGLDDDERRALQAALAAVRLGSDWADDAMVKIGGSRQSAANPWTAWLEASDSVPVLYEATTEGRLVSFTYHGRSRSLQPWGLLARHGNWYVLGWDVDAGESRTYRVDRIEGSVTAGENGPFAAPDDFDPAAAFERSVGSIGDSSGPSEALVLIDSSRAPAVLMEIDTAAVVESRTDGAVVVRVPCRNRLVFRAWLLGLVHHAEVLEPVEVRDEIVQWLEGMVHHG